MSEPFDTHKFIKRLQEAGVSEKQAEALSEAIAPALASRQATENDFVAVRSDIAKLESKLDSKIDKTAAETKAELIRWVVGVGLLQSSLIAALLLKLVH